MYSLFKRKLTRIVTRSIPKSKVEAARQSRKNGVAKNRPYKQKQAVRPIAGDERAREREILVNYSNSLKRISNLSNQPSNRCSTINGSCGLNTGMPHLRLNCIQRDFSCNGSCSESMSKPVSRCSR